MRECVSVCLCVCVCVSVCCHALSEHPVSLNEVIQDDMKNVGKENTC